MKKLKFFLSFVGGLCCISPTITEAQEFDRYGRVVKTVNGEPILYKDSDPIPQQLNLNSLDLKNLQLSDLGEIVTHTISNDSYLEYKKSSEYVVWGNSIGRAGMNSADIDGDGKLELILSCSQNYWYVAEFNASKQSYEITWASEVFDTSISCLSVIEINERILVFLGMKDGSFKVFDGYSREEIGSAKPFNSSVYGIKYADADNDGTEEIIICNETSLVLYDPAVSLGIPELRFDYGGLDIVIGNVDADPKSEIVLTSGKVLEISNNEVSVQWNYPDGFGSYLVLADVDDDEIDEVVSAAGWYNITCFDADLRSSKWQYKANLDIHVLTSYDADGDGVDEILYGDGQWGYVHCLDGNGVDVLWSIRNPEHGTTDIHIADIDSDQQMEICWSGGFTSSGEDILFVYDLTQKTEEWTNIDVVPPFLGFASGDIDNDGVKELVTASLESESGYDDGILYVLNGITNEIEWQSDPNLFSGSLWGGIQSLGIDDYDNDGQKEILVGSSSTYDSRVYFIDPARKIEEKFIQLDSGNVVKQLEVADLNQNGRNELVVQTDNHIYIVNPSTEEIIWKSISLNGSKSGFEVGNIDADPALEIIVPHGKMVTIIDGANQINFTLDTGNENISTILIDVNSDGIEDIYCADISGNTTSFEGTNYTEIGVPDLNLNNLYLTFLKSYDIDQNGVDELVINATQNRNQSYWHPSDVTLMIRRFDNFGTGNDMMLRGLPSQNNRDRIFFDDLNSDNVPEMVLGTRRGWSIWKLGNTNTIVADDLFKPTQELANGWKLSSWFGYYNDSRFPSINHPSLGTTVIHKDSTDRIFLISSDFGELEIIQPIVEDALYIRHETTLTNFYVSPTDENFNLLGTNRFYDHTLEKWVSSIVPERNDYKRFYEIAEFLLGHNQSLMQEVSNHAYSNQLELAQEKLRQMIIYHSTIINYSNTGLNAILRIIPIDGSFWKSNFENLIKSAESSLIAAQNAIQENS